MTDVTFFSKEVKCGELVGGKDKRGTKQGTFTQNITERGHMRG